jgi:dihydropteroate synthase
VAAAVVLSAPGADIVVVGGESTRRGARPVPIEEEIARIQPVIRRLSKVLTIPISIDTSKRAVAEVALGEGAVIINDVTGLRYDASLAELTARAGAGLILMHTRGRPDDMYREAHYGSVSEEIREELHASLERALAAGVPREAVILDPGLGFAKRSEHSYQALASLPVFATLGCPLLAGPSRKSFLTASIGERAPLLRDMATAASVAAAILLGAHIVRVHNVPDMFDVIRVADAVRRGASPSTC